MRVIVYQASDTSALSKNFTRKDFKCPCGCTRQMVDSELVEKLQAIRDKLGKAIKEALGDKKAIKRFGNFFLPMDETLVMCAIDLSGRPYLVYDLNLRTERVGYFDTQMVKEFFYAVSYAAEMNLNIKQFSGENDHHIIEAAFKAFAKALDEATTYDRRLNGKVLSTKGTL